MLRHITAGIFGIAALGFALPAGATPISSTANVTVNIEVTPNVSIWPDTANVNLTLDGANPQNMDTAESGLNYINNVDAKIDVLVNGLLPNPTTPGGGIQFYIFDQLSAATAEANIALNQYGPAGALTWTQATLNTSQQLTPAVGTHSSIFHRLITYGASEPGDLTAPATWGLTVTYTMTSLT
jgi:hypothetical protein